jgi:hypothetical protein
MAKRKSTRSAWKGNAPRDIAQVRPKAVTVAEKIGASLPAVRGEGVWRQIDHERESD